MSAPSPGPARGSKDDLLAQLDRLRILIGRTPEENRARLYNRAGDLHARLGEDTQALKEYGKAIDLYIEAEQIPLAVATCNKVLRRSPNAVRTHFTLACLALYEGHRIEAVQSIEAYTLAGRRSETLSMVVPRLRFLARSLADAEMREVIAQKLAELGDTSGARSIRDNPPPVLVGLIKPERAPLLLVAATRDSDSVWADFWLK